MGCPLAAELLADSKTSFKKQSLSRVKTTKKTDIKKGASGPLSDRFWELNLFTEPHPMLLEWQGWLAQ